MAIPNPEQHEDAAVSPVLQARLSRSVRVGSEWNVHRNGLMPHQPPKLSEPAKLTTMSLLARRYPAAATGRGYTSGRVDDHHVTATQAMEQKPRYFGPGAAPQALPAPQTLDEV